MAEWTHADQNAALACGWGIFDNSDHGTRIERLDDPQSIGVNASPRFESDEEAVAHVERAAAVGIPLAQKAIDFLKQHKSA